MSLEGQLIDRYRILHLLGSGGMGDVYLAEDERIKQQVAIKVIRAEPSHYPDTQTSQEAARLFQREAKAIAQLDHPQILPLYDYGEERIGKMTVIYLVTPYREEGSLADWLRQRGHAGLLSPQEVAHVVRQAASALQHAHDRQIIHQDVKPSNFLLRQRQETPTHPDLLLADFGIARLATATSNASQSIRGTPTSMAPEQWEGQPVPATDQYALAVMAYELLTGCPPFRGAPGPLMYQHLTVPPPSPSSVNPRLSTELDAVLLHALAKRPEQRFVSMTAFANAFQQAVQSMQEANVSMYMAPTPASASPGDIRAVLAISTMEAHMGTTRTLTLPGGRQVTVLVPAGVYDGQIVRLDGQGQISPVGGPAGALILTLLVKATEQTVPMGPATERPDERTALNLTEQQANVVSSDQSLQPSVTVKAQRRSFTADRSRDTLQPLQRGISRRTVVAGLAGLAVVGVAGGSLLWLVRSWPPAASSISMSTPTPLSIGTTLYTYRGQFGDVFAVAWSPDGRRIASGGRDGTAQVWDAVNGGNVYIYRGHADVVNAVPWSPSSKRIASGSDDKTVQVWDAVGGSHVYTYRGHSDNVFAVAWSPDGRRIASASKDRTVQVWDAADGGNIYTYRGHSQSVGAVAWSPFGGHIASGSDDKTVQVWDAAIGSTVYTYRGHSNQVYVVAWSPDSRHIASGGLDNTVQVWDVTNGRHVYTYRGHSALLRAVAWSPDGRRIASGSLDSTVRVWDAMDGSHVYTYRGHPGGVTAAVWSPDGSHIASGSNDGIVQVWVAV